MVQWSCYSGGKYPWIHGRGLSQPIVALHILDGISLNVTGIPKKGQLRILKWPEFRLLIIVYPCSCLSMFPPDLLCAFQFFKGIQQALDISVHRCHQVTTFNHTGEDVYCFSSPNTQPFVDSVCWVCGESNSSWVDLADGFT